MWAPWRVAPARAGLTRLSTDFGADIQTPLVGTVNLALSPNGQLLALIGTSRPGDRNRLFVRQLDQLEASPLSGTEGARNPFFSPDSRWIGFFADGRLKKIPVRGGAAIVLCEAPDDRGGSWTDDGWIVFTPTAGESPLVRVRSDGGIPERITTLTDGEITHRWPQVLPGGRAVIYTAHVSQPATTSRRTSSCNRSTVDRGSLSITGATTRGTCLPDTCCTSASRNCSRRHSTCRNSRSRRRQHRSCRVWPVAGNRRRAICVLADRRPGLPAWRR